MCDPSLSRGVDVSTAAAQLTELLQPKPELEPMQVVEASLASFKRGTNEDIEQLFNLVCPDGELAASYASSAGAMACFRWTIRREPRWKGIAGRPHAALLKLRSWDIVGSLRPSLDECRVHVRCRPFFPDAPDAESEVEFEWTLARQFASNHPEAAEALGVHDGCWMIRDIRPHYGSWTVHDALHNGRCPDYFTPPRS
jgi:hypothetical protein